MNRKQYEEVHGLFLDCSEQLANEFVASVPPTVPNIIEHTNRFVRQKLNALPQDTRELRYHLDDSLPYSRWVPELEQCLDAAQLV